MADTDKANPVLVSNQALRSPQPASDNIQATTGTILYSNGYSGIGITKMPDDWRAILNDDYGEVGNNVIVQLRQKIQQMADGPWYVDSRDGVIYIHNKKFQEPSVADYTYQDENGELLRVSFETQYITRTIRSSSLEGIDLNKNISSSVLKKMASLSTFNDYIDYNNSTYNSAAVIRDYDAGKIGFRDVRNFMEAVSTLREGKTTMAFTPAQYHKILQIHNRKVQEKKQSNYSKATTEYAKFSKTNNARQTYRDREVDRQLRTGDLEKYREDVEALFSQFMGGGSVLSHLDRATSMEEVQQLVNGYLGEGSKYVFSPEEDMGLTINTWTDDAEVSGMLGDGGKIRMRSNGMIPLGETEYTTTVGVPSTRGSMAWRNNGGTSTKVFAKTHVAASVDARKMVMIYFSRKLGYNGAVPGDANYDSVLSNRINASVNQSRRITERKLQAKATLIGRPSLASSQIITLHNVGNKWSGTWYIKKCTHKIDGSSGYTTEVELVNHRGFEGYNSATATGSHGRNTSKRTTGGDISSNTIANITFNTVEAEFYNNASDNVKVEMIVLKMAGVTKSLVSASGTASQGYNHKVESKLTLTTRATKEQMQKFGKPAAQAVSIGGTAKTKK